MCVAVYNKEGVLIDRETLSKCADANSDGMGFLALVKGEFVYFKTLNDFDEFYQRYEELRKKNENIPIALHFRLATHGGKSEEMCHPFIFGDTGFVHNGIISGVGTHLAKSDTYMFGEEVIKTLPKDWLGNRFILEMVGDFIGVNNKLILMDKSGRVVIVNEHMGDEDEHGNWFSNTYWKYRSYGYGSYGYGSYGNSTKEKDDTTYGKKKEEGEWELQDNGVWRWKKKVQPELKYPRSWSWEQQWD